MSVAARFWRLVGMRSVGAQSLALAGVQWLNANGVRIDQGAVVSSSIAPVLGEVANLQSEALVVWRAEDVTKPGFELRWSFDEAVFFKSLRLKAVTRNQWVHSALLQYSADGRVWVADVDLPGFVYPGDGQWTPETAEFRQEAASQWDEDSKTSSATIVDKSATVSGASSRVRTAPARSAGRRVFGLRLKSIASPQMFFAGFALLASWGAWNTGRVWLAYSYAGGVDAYMNGSGGPIAGLTPGGATAPGDTMYFDVDLDAGTLSVKKNAGVWSPHVAIPNFVSGGTYVITSYTPSTGGGHVALEALTTLAELGLAQVRPGARAWDGVADEPLVAVPEPACLSALAATGVGDVQQEAQIELASGSSTQDVEFGGSGCIYGSVELYAQAGNIPLPRRVRLHRSRDGLLVRETWSDAQGNYRFDDITDRYKYDVIAWDHEGMQQSVVANDLTPEVMQ